MAKPERGGVPRPRHHGRADGREPGAGRLRGVGLEPHRGQGRAVRRRARRRDRAGHARRGGRRGATSRSRWSPTCPRSRRCCSATTAPRRALAAAAWRSTCPRSRPAPAARSASGSASAASRFLDAPVHRLAAEGRGRHAHDHGRRRPRRTSSAPGRCSRRWASWCVHVGPQGHGSTVKLLNNTMAAVNAAALAEGSWPRRAGLDPDKACRWWPRAPGTRRCSSSRPGRCSSTTSTPLFKLAHMLKDVRHTLAEAGPWGSRLQVAETAAEACTRRPTAKGYGESDFAAVVIEAIVTTIRLEIGLASRAYVRIGPAPPQHCANASGRGSRSLFLCQTLSKNGL